MRIRTYKPEFFRHEALFDLERHTGLPIRVAWLGLIAVADREGRFKWRPRSIGAEVLPYDGIDFARVLDALTSAGMVVRYKVDGVEFGAIPTFKKHQPVYHREQQSKIPAPDQGVRIDPADSGPTQGHGPDLTQSCHSNSPSEFWSSGVLDSLSSGVLDSLSSGTPPLVPPRGGKAKASRTPRSRRCPEGFSPDESARRIAAERGIEIDAELAQFRDHEFATPRADWQATFRNWLRRAQPARVGFATAAEKSVAAARRIYAAAERAAAPDDDGSTSEDWL